MILLHERALRVRERLMGYTLYSDSHFMVHKLDRQGIRFFSPIVVRFSIGYSYNVADGLALREWHPDQ